MKVNDLIKKLSNLKPELRDKDIYVLSKNRMKMDCKIKFVKKDQGCLDLNKENVLFIVLTEE